MKGNNFQGVIMQGVGLLFIGISTIFFSVLIGFFKTLTSSSGTLAPWVGLPQVVPVTPLIIWVVMILLGVVAIGAGEKSMLEKPGKYADFMLIGIGMLFLGISVVFLLCYPGILRVLNEHQRPRGLHRLGSNHPCHPVNHLGDDYDFECCQYRRRRRPHRQEKRFTGRDPNPQLIQ